MIINNWVWTGRFRAAWIPLLVLLAGMSAPISERSVTSADIALQIAFGPICPRLDAAGAEIVLSYQGAIWRMPRAGGPLTRLTAGAGFDIEPVWSPDGKYVAYIESRDFYGGPLRLIRTDGSPVKLPREVNARGKLHFDLQGKELLGNFQAPGEPVTLAWYDLQTGHLSPVSIESNPPTPASDPSRRRPNTALSPDGKWIALVTTQDLSGEQEGNNGPQNDIWRVPARGGQPLLFKHFPARIHDLSWSSDGSKLIVATELGGVHNDLWEVPIGPRIGEPGYGDARLIGVWGPAVKLTFGQADEDRPSMSANGRWLLYLDNRGGPTALVVRDLKNDKEEFAAVKSFDYRRPTGPIEIYVREMGGPQTARLSLQHADGKFHAPPGSLYRLSGGDLHFYTNGTCKMTVPAGRYVLKAWRGPEYRPFRRELIVEPDHLEGTPVDLERWIFMRPRGWISGESHIHANYGYGQWYNSPETMRLQCRGEDLTVANLMVANSDGDGVYDREFFRGQPDPLSNDATVLYWNEEFRSTIWGHMTLLNLKYLVTPIFTGFAGTTHPNDWPTNADIADNTHDEDGLVNYTHPANNVHDPYLSPYSAKSMPLDVALGKVDSMDVMGSVHEANLPVWYRLLNCGLRVPASAGTDCFLNRINSRLPGSDRVYVHCPGAFSYRGWIDNLKAGRTFVTNGPMLDLTVEGRTLGETVRLKRPGPVRVKGRADSQYPLDLVEIVVNGRVVQTVKAEGDRRSIVFDLSVPIDRTGWIALVTEGPRPAAQSLGSMPELFAHTSPIYLQVPGQPIRAREDAQYFLAWIDRLWRDVRKRDRIPPSRRAHVEAQIAAGKAFYRKVAAQSR